MDTSRRGREITIQRNRKERKRLKEKMKDIENRCKLNE